ncbi:MAG: WecB/TagA/CpsF family glycosyltransferase [Leptolyngbyaceae cyanobacterium]
MSFPTINLTGTPVTTLPLEEQVQAVLDWAERFSSRVVCLANVHMLMESRWDTTFRQVLEDADLVTPDGMPLVWMIKAMGIKKQDRVAGMDFFLRACQRAADQGVQIYLLGSTQDVLSRMQQRLKTDFPSLSLAGVESPPFRPLTPAEDRDLIQRINQSGAGLTFVSLGCPKQERWMAEHKDKVRSVMVGIGAVFEVYAGTRKHAPKWIRDLGLEWLYRLVQEPRRLWKRYWKTIPPFILLATHQIANESGLRRRLPRF